MIKLKTLMDMKNKKISWSKVQALGGEPYVCGYCSKTVAPDKGYSGQTSQYAIRICSYCTRPSYFEVVNTANTIVVPPPRMGKEISKLPEDIEYLHNEIKDASASSSYSLAVMGCRKMLMHIAVEHGADEGKKFLEYVDYLEENHCFPQKSKQRIDGIRKMGNETNHNITINSKDELEEILAALDILLSFNYEFADEEEQTAAQN